MRLRFNTSNFWSCIADFMDILGYPVYIIVQSKGSTYRALSGAMLRRTLRRFWPRWCPLLDRNLRSFSLPPLPWYVALHLRVSHFTSHQCLSNTTHHNLFALDTRLVAPSKSPLSVSNKRLRLLFITVEYPTSVRCICINALQSAARTYICSLPPTSKSYAVTSARNLDITHRYSSFGILVWFWDERQSSSALIRRISGNDAHATIGRHQNGCATTWLGSSP